MSIDIKVPPLGESVTEAIIARWMKAPGETFGADEAIVELETDKVTLEVPAPVAGVMVSHMAAVGDTVDADAIIAVIDENGAAAPAATSAPAKKEKPAPVSQQAAPAPVTGAVSDHPSSPAVKRLIDIKVPPLGESVTEAIIARWMKAPGETFGADEAIVELETDKVTLEVPAPVAGVMVSHMAAVGDTVDADAIIAVIDENGAAAPAATSAPAKEEKPAPVPQQAAPASVTGGVSDHPLSPAVKRLVEENNLDPRKIAATGKDGRLTKGDVLAAIESGSASAPALQASSSPLPVMPRTDDSREERVPMTRLRKVIAQRLKNAQNTAAMLTTFNEVDMSNVMALRSEYRDAFEKTYGARLGFMSFFVHAAIEALKEFPAVNAEIHGDDVIYKNFYNIGVAVGTPQGLVVPVLKDADQMSFAEIEGGINMFGTKARDGQLSMDDMSGGTFTISNGGVYGSMMSTPILNTPQSGILGMHNIQKRAVVVSGSNGDSIEIRPMMYLALSYDHRIVDGREAVSFLVRIKDKIEDPRRMLLGL